MKIGIVGLGSIGQRHATNLTTLGHKVYCYDPAYPNGHGGVQPLAAAMDGIDGYVICSPTRYHIEDIYRYAETGKPLFVEKPVGVEFIDKLPEQVKMVGYNLRYHACVEAAREWLTMDGAIGKPLWANFTVAQYNDKPDYRRDGVILNWSHEIDLALHLLGPAQVTVAHVGLEGGQDVMADICLLHGDNDAHSVVHLDYLTRPELRQSIIVGEDGQIIVDLVNRNAWLRDPRGDVVDHLKAHDTYDMNYRAEMADFIGILNGIDKGPWCTADEAIQVVQICADVRKQAGL